MSTNNFTAKSKYHRNMQNPLNPTRADWIPDIKNSMVDFCNSQKWDYFFTGTFKTQYTPNNAANYTRLWFADIQEDLLKQDIQLNFLWFIEGFRNDPDNYLNDYRYDKMQGSKVKNTRAHVHAVLRFYPEQDIKMNKENPFIMWSDWFNNHGRCQIDKIAAVDDAVAYVTKYMLKAQNSADRWGIG